MSETENNDLPTAPETTSHGAQDVPETEPDWKNEAEKWKALSRKHENAFKKASDELEKRRQEQMTEAERTVAEARNQGRAEALQEYGKRLAEAELKATAATAGVQLPDALSSFIDTSRLLSEDGQPNTEAIASVVAALAPSAPQPPKFQPIPQGPQGGSSAGQLTREDLARMTPQEINQARREGRLSNLMSGGS